MSDVERVTEISSDLQEFGKQTGIAVLALSQLSRPQPGQKSFPGMHSFRQSGQIEQDADVALLLFRENEDDPDNQVRTLKIGKNKEGEANVSLSMYLDGDTQTFSRVVPGENHRTKTKKMPHNTTPGGRKPRARKKRAPNQVKTEEGGGDPGTLPF